MPMPRQRAPLGPRPMKPQPVTDPPQTPPPDSEKQSQSQSESQSLDARATRGAMWTTLGFGASQVLRLAGNAVVAHLLFAEAFGLMTLVNVFIVGLHLFSDLGIGPSLIQSKRGLEPVFVNTAFTMQAGRGLVLCLVACAGAVPLAHAYGQPMLAYMVPVVGFNSILQGLNSTNLFTANRHLALGRLTVIDLVSQVVGVVTMVIWAWLSPTAWALVAASVTSSLCRLLLSHLGLPGMRNRFTWDKVACRQLLRYGRWIFLSTVLTFLSGQSDRLIFGKLVDIQQLGVFSLAVMVAMMPAQALSAVVGKVVFPVFSQIHNEGGDLSAAYRRVRWPILVLSGWTTAGLIAGGPTIIELIYDPRYAQAGWMVQVVAAGAWFGLLLEGTNGSVLLACGLARWTAAGSAAKFAAMIVLIYAGHRLAGFPGALLGATGAELARYLVSTVGARRQRLLGLDQDLLLTGVIAGSAALGLGSAHLCRLRGWPLAVEAAAVFVSVSVAWIPLGRPLLLRRLRGRR